MKHTMFEIEKHTHEMRKYGLQIENAGKIDMDMADEISEKLAKSREYFNDLNFDDSRDAFLMRVGLCLAAYNIWSPSSDSSSKLPGYETARRMENLSAGIPALQPGVFDVVESGVKAHALLNQRYVDTITGRTTVSDSDLKAARAAYGDAAVGQAHKFAELYSKDFPGFSDVQRHDADYIVESVGFDARVRYQEAMRVAGYYGLSLRPENKITIADFGFAGRDASSSITDRTLDSVASGVRKLELLGLPEYYKKRQMDDLNAAYDSISGQASGMEAQDGCEL